MLPYKQVLYKYYAQRQEWQEENKIIDINSKTKQQLFIDNHNDSNLAFSLA